MLNHVKSKNPLKTFQLWKINNGSVKRLKIDETLNITNNIFNKEEFYVHIFKNK